MGRVNVMENVAENSANIALLNKTKIECFDNSHCENGICVKGTCMPILMSGLLLVTGGDSEICEVIDMTNSASSCNDLPPYPYKFRLTTGVVVGSVPVIAGGYNPGYRSDVFKFDRSTYSWVSIGNMYSKRNQFSSVPFNGGMLVMGGYSAPILKSTEVIYLNGTINKGVDLPTNRARHCSVLLENGNILIMGGSGSGSMKTVTIFDATTSS